MPNAAAPAFNLRRYFSLASLAAFVIAALVVGLLSYWRAREALLQSSEEYAASIAQNLSYQLAQDPTLHLAASDAGISLEIPAAASALAATLPARLYGLNLDKFKVFDAHGKIVFSTEAGEVGDVEAENEGIATARTGKTFSEYGSIPHDQNPQNLPGAFIETYAPLLVSPPPGKSPLNIGTVEIYRDVTDLNAEITRSALIAAGAVGLAMLALYLVLLVIVQRADRILTSQRLALENQNQQLEQLQQYRNDLTNMVVHDLRNPLTSMIGNLSMLEEDTVHLDGQERAMIASTLESSQEVMSMLNDLLSTNRMEQGKVALKSETFEAGEWLRGRAERLGGAAQRQGKRISVRVDPAQLRLTGDRSLLSRVVDNLLTNAMHHTTRGNEITLCALQGTERGNVVSVTDKGEGIAAEYLPHIFDKFYRVQGGKQHPTGMGLGLAFCKLAVEAHGGTIWVTSEPGEGSTFSFSLPEN